MIAVAVTVVVALTGKLISAVEVVEGVATYESPLLEEVDDTFGLGEKVIVCEASGVVYTVAVSDTVALAALVSVAEILVAAVKSTELLEVSEADDVAQSEDVGE